MSETPETVPAVRHHYFRALPLIVYSLMCYFMTGTVSGIINVAAVLLEQDRGWDAALLTSAISIASLINVVAGFIAGRVATKHSARPLCAGWGALFIIGMVAMGISAHVGVFIVAMCLANAASSAWGYNTVPILITNWFPTKKGTIQGFVSTGILLGSATPMVYTWAYRTWGPECATIPFIVFAAVALVILAFGVTDWPEQMGLTPDTMERCERVEDPRMLHEMADEGNGAEEDSKSRIFAAGTLALFTKNPAFFGLTIVMGIQLVYSGGIMTQLVPRLVEVGFTLDQSTAIMMVASLVACVGSFLAGIIGDKLGARAGVLLTFALGAIGVALNLVPNAIVVFMSVVFIGCVVGSADNWPVNICAELFGRERFSNAFGVMFPVIQLIGAIGPALIAQVASAFGGYRASYLLLCALMIVGLVLFAPLSRAVERRC